MIINYGSTGWICPICGKGVSPWRDNCPCKDMTYEAYFSTDTNWYCQTCKCMPCICNPNVSDGD